MMEHDSLIGLHLGAYLIQQKLGEGAMARVYKAYHSRLRREVAIKVIRPEAAARPGFAERFEREAQVIARLEHPHIVGVYDFGEQVWPDRAPITYLVMQYVAGGTLRALLREQQPLELPLAVRYARDMARALHHAHERGIVHRDVKPQNMLIASNARRDILLSDFGIAKLFDQRGTAEPDYSTLGGDASSDHLLPARHRELTSAGQLIGTIEYMAPEQIRMQPVDARTDVYALGMVLFQMLTGRPPFNATSAVGLLYQHVHQPAPDVREINPALSESLALITARALAKAPEQRFQSAEEMALALDALLPPTTDELRASFISGPTHLGLRQAALQGEISVEASAQGMPGEGHERPRIAPPVTRTSQTAASASGPASSLSAPRPTSPTTWRSRLSMIGAALLILGLLGLLLSQSGWLHLIGGPAVATTPASQTTTFTDTFQDNHLQWTENAPNFNTAIGNGRYIITIGQTPPATYYFPYPAAVGPLPQNFTLSTQIQRLRGGAENWYGLVFRLRQQGSYVSCYALVIDGVSHYALWKFNASSAQPGTPLSLVDGSYQKSKTGIDTLEVTVHGDTITARINNASLDFNSPAHAVNDVNGYSGGLPGLLVTGPTARFSIQRMSLSLVH